MCAELSMSLSSRQEILRTELKTWEKDFSHANGGRKAGRDDIKKEPKIAALYKEYTKLRSISSKAVDQTTHSTPRKSSKRKSEGDIYATARHPATIDPYDAPQSATPRAARTTIGPTPQKNGQVLGLFDMLSPYSARSVTPSKRKSIAGMFTEDIIQTPSRKKSGTQEIDSSNLFCTPSSSAKRRRTDQTPRSRKNAALAEMPPGADRLNKTIVPDMDQTPAFLKRFSEPSSFIDMENELGQDINYTPPRMRLPRKPAGRSLSQLVQSLREQEDERLDEEMDLMREMETGQPVVRPKLLVQDSQIGDLPLGADGEHDGSDEEAAEDPLQLKRLWKKKGQKRTTRRANIGVNRAKWKPEAQWKATEDDINDDTGVADTQGADGNAVVDNDSDAANDEEKTARSMKGATAAPAKKPRMINPNATSHANFRSLKLRNKNSKGKKGGRFGKR